MRRSGMARMLILAALYGVAFLGMHPMLWDGVHTLGWDAMVGGWPDLEFIAQSFARGELPLWNPYEMTGYSFLGDPEAALLYPFNWIVALFRALCGGGSWMIVFKNLFHIVFGALGIHLYLQRQRMPQAACWTGGLSYMLSGRLAKGKDQAPIWTVAWMPWMLIALEETIARPSRRTGLLLGVTTALALLSGYVPNFFRSALALLPIAAVALCSMLAEVGPARRRAYLSRLLQASAIAGGIVLLLGLPTMVAVRDTFASSARAALTIDEVLRSAFKPSYLLYSLAPALAPRQIADFLIAYVGALPLLLALLALVSRCDRWRLCWGLLAASFFLLAGGKSGVLLPALVRVLPAVFRPWRIPEQYLYVAVFFLCVLAARGMADCLEATRAEAARMWRRALVLALAASGVGLWGMLRPHPDPVAARVATTTLVVLVLAGASMLGLLVVSAPRRRFLAVLSIGLLLVDLGLHLRQPIYDIAQPKPDVRRDSILAGLSGLADEGRLADDGYLGYRVGLRRQGVREYFGRFTALVSERFRGMQERARRSYGLLAAGNVRYYVGPNIALLRRQAGPRARLVAPGVLELLERAPVAYWTADARIVSSPREALALLESLRAGSTAILEAEYLDPATRRQIVQLAGSPLKPVAAQVEHLGLNRLRLSVTAPARGLLVISERYAPSWQATVDGKPTALLQANYAFRALLIGPGRHLVEMHYPGAKICVALVLYALTAVGLLAIALIAVVGPSCVTRLKRVFRPRRK